MTTIREMLENIERDTMVARAARSAETRGRDREEPEDDLRPSYQHDRDRIIHCKAFRRLKHKTQVFLAPEGDHYRQSVRVVEKLENDGRGLNLTVEVRDGILKHSKGEKGELLRTRPKSRALTLEGDIVRISDIIAYVNHDIDDGIRAGIIASNDIPKPIRDTLGRTGSARIDRMV